ncbi:MAG: Glutamyl-tRNA reductase [Syntrophus sp. SKADARSKE-3]|nr:Glutamyl-tRNA reductase [Syntrophus sp. SKADARSKE-3]
MNIILIGMNHITAPLEIRERLSLSCGDGFDPLSEMKQLSAVEESVYLATCNRVEILAGVRNHSEAERGLRRMILQHGNLSEEDMSRCLYIYRDKAALCHLFRVASSLDSLIMGEPQILGQVKDAYRQAVENGTTGVILNKALHFAFRAAKRVRTETGIANNAVSVSYAAVELAKKIFGSLKGKRALLIGAGEMSELAARHLLNHGVDRLMVANRTYARAVQLADEFRGEPVRFDRLEDMLGEVDIVISSTGATGYVLTPEMLVPALRRRKNRLLFLIDIAVPRDIDPRTGKMDNVYLYNMDDLQDIADENMNIRKEEALKAEKIVAEEVQKYLTWFNTLEVVPTIVSLREKVEGIVREEMERSGAWLRNMKAEDRESVEILAKSIVNKILHGPMTALKEESQHQGGPAYVATIRRLFRLEDGER